MFKGLYQLLMKRLGRKKKSADEDEQEEEIAAFSMNEGKPDQVFGVRREIVNGVGIFFIVIFCLAFIFATGDDEEEKVKETSPTISDADIASLKKPKNLPNDYETFVAQNQAANDEAAKQKSQDTRQQNTAPVTATTSAPIATTPIIPRNYSAVPIIPATTQRNESVAEKTKEPEKPKNDRYKSAISFSLGNNTIDETNNATPPTATKENTVTNSFAATQTATSAPVYAQPNAATINAGTTIPVRLITGINTDVEGQIKAEVLSDVYDSATRTKLLIPQGSKITGSYERGKAMGGRVPISFRQLIFPDGGSWTVAGNMVAVDGAGFTGIQGKVHHHTGQKISGGAIGAGIAALGSLAAGNTSSQDTYTAGQLASQGALANMITASSQMLTQAASIQDTVTVEPGYEFNVYVIENLSF